MNDMTINLIGKDLYNMLIKYSRSYISYPIKPWKSYTIVMKWNRCTKKYDPIPNTIKTKEVL